MKKEIISAIEDCKIAIKPLENHIRLMSGYEQINYFQSFICMAFDRVCEQDLSYINLSDIEINVVTNLNSIVDKFLLNKIEYLQVIQFVIGNIILSITQLHIKIDNECHNLLTSKQMTEYEAYKKLNSCTKVENVMQQDPDGTLRYVLKLV